MGMFTPDLSSSHHNFCVLHLGLLAFKGFVGTIYAKCQGVVLFLKC